MTIGKEFFSSLLGGSLPMPEDIDLLIAVNIACSDVHELAAYGPLNPVHTFHHIQFHTYCVTGNILGRENDVDQHFCERLRQMSFLVYVTPFRVRKAPV